MRILVRLAQVFVVVLLTLPSGTGLIASAQDLSLKLAPAPLTPGVSLDAILTPDELLQYQPNELGVIPVFMYHNIMDDPEEGVSDENAHLYRRADELYADLQWLYDRDFYLSGMLPLITGRIDVPAGKHPVVLTFDDSSSMHLSFQIGADGQPIKDENGEYIPTPDCAVGIIEQFAKDHPDFGKTAHFGIIPVFRFSWPQYEQDELVGAKLQWLLDHGYEIGNHTSDHNDLAQAEFDDFARMIAEPFIWSADYVDPDSPGYAMNVLTLPFGAYEEGGWSGDKREYLVNGYTWDGHQIKIDAILLVCCGPSPSFFSNDWASLWIPRIRGDDPDYAAFGAQIDRGDFILYTSDGDPDTIAVPWPLPPVQWGDLDKERVAEAEVHLVRYDPDTGHVFRDRKEPKSHPPGQ